MIDYEVWLEEPTIDQYRQGYSPRADYSLAGMWPGAVLAGASGRWYHGMRGFDELAVGMAHTYTFMELRPGDRYNFGTQLYEELPIDEFEPYEYSETNDAVLFVGEHVNVQVREGSFDWSDAGGRYELHVEQVGSACTLWVPEQDGIPDPIQHRSQIGKAVGHVNGDPVEGFTFLDWSYSRPGVVYFNLPLIRKLEKQWSMWLVEYADGELDAGFVWKGRGDTGFRASHLIVDGRSQAIHQGITDTTYDDRGTVWRTRLEVGDQVIDLEQDTVSDWPSHTFGPVTSTSRSTEGKEIAKSWNYCEWMPDNTEPLLELYLQGVLRVEDTPRAKVENECVIYPEEMLRGTGA